MKWKTVWKWGLRLLILAVLAVVLFILSLDSILRVIIERQIREQTGMQAQIEKFHFGLLDPVVEIKNLQLYNTPEFGGAPFLTIPEIYVEYDKPALKKNQIHITLLRFNLGELDVVKGQDGQTNILSLGLQVPSKQTAAEDTSKQLAELKKRTNMDFKGIDCLNASVGTFKYLDLQNQTNNMEQKIGIDNLVLTNVTSVADLVGLGLLVTVRSGDFFKPLIDPNDSGPVDSAQELLKLLGH